MDPIDQVKKNILYLEKERLTIKIEMNILMDDMVDDRNTINNISRNHLLKVWIKKLDTLNYKIEILKTNLIL